MYVRPSSLTIAFCQAGKPDVLLRRGNKRQPWKRRWNRAFVRPSLVPIRQSTGFSETPGRTADHRRVS